MADISEHLERLAIGDMLHRKAGTEALLAEQERLVNLIYDIDSDLAGAETDIADAETDIADAAAAAEEAQKEMARATAVARDARAKIDAAAQAWKRLSDRLTAAGIGEQYWISDLSLISEYAKEIAEEIDT